MSDAKLYKGRALYFEEENFSKPRMWTGWVSAESAKEARQRVYEATGAPKNSTVRVTPWGHDACTKFDELVPA